MWYLTCLLLIILGTCAAQQSCKLDKGQPIGCNLDNVCPPDCDAKNHFNQTCGTTGGQVIAYCCCCPFGGGSRDFHGCRSNITTSKSTSHSDSSIHVTGGPFLIAGGVVVGVALIGGLLFYFVYWRPRHQAGYSAIA
jgi:hypothetical protein